MPYLPIDPHDVGRSYEAVVRVNSQSGKGGVAYLLKAEHQLDLPRRLQIEFSGVVQAKTDSEGGEVSAAQLWEIFQDEYLPAVDGAVNTWGRFTPVSHSLISEQGGVDKISATMLDRGTEVVVEGTGNGPIAAFIDALSTLGVDVRVLDYAEHALSAGGDAKAAAYVECAVGDRVLWGVGLHSSIVKASLTAVLSAVNRAERMASSQVPHVSATCSDASAARRHGGATSSLHVVPSASADAAGAELDRDARADRLAGLGDGVVPGALARATHDDEVAVAEREAPRLAAAARTQATGCGPSRPTGSRPSCRGPWRGRSGRRARRPSRGRRGRGTSRRSRTARRAPRRSAGSAPRAPR